MEVVLTNIQSKDTRVEQNEKLSDLATEDWIHQFSWTVSLIHFTVIRNYLASESTVFSRKKSSNKFTGEEKSFTLASSSPKDPDHWPPSNLSYVRSMKFEIRTRLCLLPASRRRLTPLSVVIDRIFEEIFNFRSSVRMKTRVRYARVRPMKRRNEIQMDLYSKSS